MIAEGDETFYRSDCEVTLKNSKQNQEKGQVVLPTHEGLAFHHFLPRSDFTCATKNRSSMSLFTLPKGQLPSQSHCTSLTMDPK